MKKIATSALVALALIGSVASASAIPVPGHDATLTESLNFWAQFGERDSD